MVAPKSRKKPRQARSKATVEAILGGAARVFVEHGIDGATTNHIAAAAGVSVGSLYQYFPNKEALAAELIERHLGELLDILTNQLSTVAHLPVADAVPLMVRAMFEVHQRETELHRVLTEAGSRVGMDSRKREVMNQFHQLVRVYFESHREEVGLGDLDLGAYIVVFAVENVMREVVLAPPGFALDDVVRQVSAMCLSYLGAASPLTTVSVKGRRDPRP